MMKIAQACQQCRRAKRQCVRNNSALNAACITCLQRRVSCSRANLDTPRRVLAPRGGLRGECNGEDEIHLPPVLAEELVEQYLSKIHDRPHSLFHTPSLLADLRNGRIDRALLLALCAFGAYLTKRRALAVALTAQSKQLVLASLEEMTVQTIQACILIANICAANAEASSEALFFSTILLKIFILFCVLRCLGIAIGMVQIKRIADVNETEPAVLRETKLRIWWTLFMADHWYSSSLGLRRDMLLEDAPIPLPMDERVFYDLAPSQSKAESNWKPGLWAHMVTLVQLFGPIQDLNRQSSQCRLDQAAVDQQTATLAEKLDQFVHALPSDMQMNEVNLETHGRQGTGGSFVALHLGFHHYATLLFFQYLDAGLAPTVERTQFAARCRNHAASYSTLLQRGRQQTQPCWETVYPTVAQMTVVSSSVLLHTLLFGVEEELANARAALHANFAALVELEQYWPIVTLLVYTLDSIARLLLTAAR